MAGNRWMGEQILERRTDAKFFFYSREQLHGLQRIAAAIEKIIGRQNCVMPAEKFVPELLQFSRIYRAASAVVLLRDSRRMPLDERVAIYFAPAQHWNFIEHDELRRTHVRRNLRLEPRAQFRFGECLFRHDVS